MTKYITMSQKEIDRVPIIQQVLDKKITSVQAANILYIGSRQFRRIKKRYIEQWSEWLIHKWRWRQSNRRFSDKFIDEVKTIMTDNLYKDFKPKFMSEKLLEKHNIKISPEKTRQIMVELWIWTVKSRGSPRQHKKRKRKDNYWEMQQFDGSYHLWFEGRNWWEYVCLLLSVDDATGKITHAKFDKNEWKKAVFSFWKEYVIKHGKPHSIYLDKFSTHKVNYPTATYEPEVVTEFQRVCQTIGINMITAHTPQAKWRVERLNETLQDRLVKEMRLRGIDNIEDANKYLEEEYIDKFNNNFAVEATTEIDLHKELTSEENKELNWIFSEHHTRVINNDYTISYKNQYYQLFQGTPRIYPKLRVSVEEQFNGKIRIVYREKELVYEKIDQKPPKYTIEEQLRMKEEKESRAKELELVRFNKSKERQKKYRLKRLISKHKSLN